MLSALKGPITVKKCHASKATTGNMMMNAISDTGGMTVSAMTAGGSGVTKLNLNFGSAA